MPRRLLIVVTTEVADDALRDLVRSRAGDDAEMLVVAPASRISRLDWLTNAEDDARDDAASLAEKTAEATPTDNVKASVGDSDPLKAIEDALRTFPAGCDSSRRSSRLVGGGHRRESPSTLASSGHPHHRR
jgi:hypothetical protein